MPGTASKQNKEIAMNTTQGPRTRTVRPAKQSHCRKFAALVAVTAVTVTAAEVRYSIVPLGTLGGASSFGSAINRHGQISGWAQAADGNAHAFLYDSGTL